MQASPCLLSSPDGSGEAATCSACVSQTWSQKERGHLEHLALEGTSALPQQLHGDVSLQGETQSREVACLPCHWEEVTWRPPRGPTATSACLHVPCWPAWLFSGLGRSIPSPPTCRLSEALPASTRCPPAYPQVHLGSTRVFPVGSLYCSYVVT